MPTPLCTAAEQAARLSTTQWSDGSVTLNRTPLVVVHERDLARIDGFSQTGTDIAGYALVERDAALAARAPIVWDPWAGVGSEVDVSRRGPRMPAGCPSVMVVTPVTPVPSGETVVPLGPVTLGPAPFWRVNNPLAWLVGLGASSALAGILVWWQRNR